MTPDVTWDVVIKTNSNHFRTISVWNVIITNFRFVSIQVSHLRQRTAVPLLSVKIWSDGLEPRFSLVIDSNDENIIIRPQNCIQNNVMIMTHYCIFKNLMVITLYPGPRRWLGSFQNWKTYFLLFSMIFLSQIIFLLNRISNRIFCCKTVRMRLNKFFNCGARIEFWMRARSL